MGFLFAMCDNCNAIYNTGIKITNSSDIKMENNSFGKCDICNIGNVMSVDGLYSEINNVMSIVTIDDGKDLEKLYNILKGVTEDMSIDEIEDKINEETPQYKNIMNLVREWCDKYNSVFDIAHILVTMLLLVNTNLFGNSVDDDTEPDRNQKTINEQQKLIEKQQIFIEEQNKIIEENKTDGKE